MEKWQEKGPRANSRAKMPQMDCVQNKEESRKNLALIIAPLLFNFFAPPTKTICAAKALAPARICRAPAKPMVTARVPSFAAMTTAPGLRGSTAARRDAKRLVVVVPVAPAGKMRVSVQAAGTA